MNEKLLSYIHLSDAYERKARLVPGLLSVIPLLPLLFIVELQVIDFFKSLMVSLGIGGVLGVGIAYFASAIGNRAQEEIWPNWPYDSPTHISLSPFDTSHSKQQKQIWYASIKKITGIDIEKAIRQEECENEIQNLINDAIVQIKHKLWNNPIGERVSLYNSDYGLVRNLYGLRPLWLSFSILSSIGAWAVFIFNDGSLLIGIASTGLLFIALIFAFFVLPHFVRTKASQYAESILASLVELASKMERK